MSKYNSYSDDELSFKGTKGGESAKSFASLKNSSRRVDESFQPVLCQPLEVSVADYGTFDAAMRAFRAKWQKEKIQTELKMRSAWETKSQKRRRKSLEAAQKRKEQEMEARKGAARRSSKQEDPSFSDEF